MKTEEEDHEAAAKIEEREALHANAHEVATPRTLWARDEEGAEAEEEGPEEEGEEVEDE